MWVTVSVVSKFLYLLGCAAVVGGLLGYIILQGLGRQLIAKVMQYMILGALLGAVASVCYFLAQVGAINDSGVAGIFDWTLAAMLAGTSLGLSAAWRVAGLFLGLAIVITLAWKGWSPLSLTLKAIGIAAFSMLMFGMIATSFPLAGHVSTLPGLFGVLLAGHVLAVLLWTGSLLPLWVSCSYGSPRELKVIMERYGTVAIAIVLLVLVSGSVILFQLLNNISELFGTAYGRGLLVKLLSVGLLLLLAARHKFSLVPNLVSDATILRLKRSIGVEILLAIGVLAITAYVTTAVGPSMDH